MKSKKNNFNQLSDWENQPSKEKIRRKKKKKAYAKDVDERRQFIIYLIIKKINMKYYNQVMGSLEKLDVGLNKLHQLIKNGKQTEAVQYMRGDLKELFEDHQSMIKVAGHGNNLGARGTSQTGTF